MRDHAVLMGKNGVWALTWWQRWLNTGWILEVSCWFWFGA